MEALFIVFDSSVNNSLFQDFCFISLTAIEVPFLQGVHCPQLSSSKNRNIFSAASRTRSLSDRTTTAAEPIKLPSGCKVSKSSGTSLRLAGNIPDDGPPGWYALNWCPLAMPPAAPIMSVIVEPAGNRYTPGLATRPDTENLRSPRRQFFSKEEHPSPSNLAD